MLDVGLMYWWEWEWWNRVGVVEILGGVVVENQAEGMSRLGWEVVMAWLGKGHAWTWARKSPPGLWPGGLGKWLWADGSASGVGPAPMLALRNFSDTAADC